jgi:hypothetical protein
MTSNWALPTNINQYSEPGGETAHISWEEVDNFNSLKTLNGKFIKTTRELYHIARDPRHDITEKTYFLRCTGFNFSNIPNSISGIEVRLTSNRFGRITDDTIQLCLNGEKIGENRANLSLDQIKTYGSNSDVWETTLSANNIQNSSFGIVLRFKSHPNWPHKCSMLIDAVEIRVH